MSVRPSVGPSVRNAFSQITAWRIFYRVFRLVFLLIADAGKSVAGDRVDLTELVDLAVDALKEQDTAERGPSFEMSSSRGDGEARGTHVDYSTPGSHEIIS